MPLDRNWPQFGDLLTSVRLRDQWNSLDDKIAAVPAGPPGPPGAPFADAVVDAVNTLNPGDPATVSVTFDGTTVHFTFNLPRGGDGPPGASGGPGDQGPPGPPGEVTNQQLTDALAGTARNPAGIGPFSGDFSDPPTQQEMRDHRDYVEAFRQAVMR
ncbi:MAG: hypothetical protein HY301_10475 [Verrucomicrobia bacterium]|nr:hypothetical protein [Verrucomicrobiota bacterium]